MSKEKKRIGYWRWLRTRKVFTALKEWFEEKREEIQILLILIGLLGGSIFLLVSGVIVFSFTSNIVFSLYAEVVGLVGLFFVWTYFVYWVESEDC